MSAVPFVPFHPARGDESQFYLNCNTKGPRPWPSQLPRGTREPYPYPDPESPISIPIPSPKRNPYALFMRQETLRSPVPIANWFDFELALGSWLLALLGVGVGGFLCRLLSICGLVPSELACLSGSLSPQRPIRHLSLFVSSFFLFIFLVMHHASCHMCHVVFIQSDIFIARTVPDLESRL